MRHDETPVFDRAIESTRIDLDTKEGWQPTRQRRPRGQLVFRYGSDGPSIDWRQDAQAARLTSNRYSGQAANDNQDWPLAKLLRTENNDHCLRLAERYRDTHNAANAPCELRGKDMADNVYLMHRLDIDASTGKLQDKGEKKVTGQKVPVQEHQPRRSAKADPDKTKQRARPVPKKWKGDWPLLHKIDAGRELAAARAALGPLRNAFEAACVGGETLETVGREHGVGNQAGAKGAGRALVMLALQTLDQHWNPAARQAA